MKNQNKVFPNCSGINMNKILELLQLNFSINQNQIKIICFKCSLKFNKENIKICEICFKTVHAACYNSDNYNKKSHCDKCELK